MNNDPVWELQIMNIMALEKLGGGFSTMEDKQWVVDIMSASTIDDLVALGLYVSVPVQSLLASVTASQAAMLVIIGAEMSSRGVCIYCAKIIVSKDP